MRVLTVEEVRCAEKEAVLNGTSYETLMENAGTQAAQQLEALALEYKLKKHILFLCGKGNNAGDAFVAARVLAGAGWHCEILLLCGSAFTPLADQNANKLPGSVSVFNKLNQADFTAPMVCDAVFGIGFKGNLSPAVATAFQCVLKTALRIALDIPSGLEADTGAVDENAFRADITLTFGAYKPALVMESVKYLTGDVRCLSIGL